MLFLLMHKATDTCPQVVCGTNAEDIRQAYQMMSNAIQNTIDKNMGKNKHIMSDNYSVTFQVRGLTHQLWVKPIRYCTEVI